MSARVTLTALAVTLPAAHAQVDIAGIIEGPDPIPQLTYLSDGVPMVVDRTWGDPHGLGETQAREWIRPEVLGD